MRMFVLPASLISLMFTVQSIPAEEGQLKVVQYRNPGLVVDLGVGLWAWPMPMDFDRDGAPDLVVSCPDKPYNGTYWFENPGDGSPTPVFEPGVRIGPGHRNIQVSFTEGMPRVLLPGTELVDFRSDKFDSPKQLGPPQNVHVKGRKIRANQWKYVDYDGDGLLDLSVGVGDWQDYGWDDAYNDQGEWTNGPLRGFVYLLRNLGPDAAGEPQYAQAERIEVEGQPLETFGWPSPSFEDLDGDGDLDIVCGEFLDGFSYFENTGSRTHPRYARPRRLRTESGELQMDLQMIVPVLFDWDGDQDFDIICGDEDGRVAFIENTGQLKNGMPVYREPVYFRQQARDLKCGALATPFACDWDEDGDEDILCGNTAGYIGLFENLDGRSKPRFAKLRYLEVDGRPIRIQAGSNGSIQGPCEAKWGYTTLNAADWDHDGRLDIVVNSIWGSVEWYRNIGRRGAPKLEAARQVRVAWNGPPKKPEWVWWKPAPHQLVTQWRTTPVVVDWNRDGLNDLVMLDHQGYLAFFERTHDKVGNLILKPGNRVFFDEQGNPLRLNKRRAGGSGRRKLHLVDWNGDGRLDLLANSVNANLYLNASQDGVQTEFRSVGPIDNRNVAGHTSSPTTVDWNHDGIPDLLVGAEDGRLYHRLNPRSTERTEQPD